MCSKNPIYVPSNIRPSVRRTSVLLALASVTATASFASPTPPRSADTKPNILLIYADDVGYGDLGCYGATKVTTPNIDKLAQTGLRFTDAHSTASVCTPSRYSILTGLYAFRNPNAQILPGDAPLLINPSLPTLPGVLKAAGYHTAAIGKWHLGLGNGNVDWNKDIAPGPLEVGFDTSFIIPATPDRVPCVYIDDHRVSGLDVTDPLAISYNHKIGNDPTGVERPDLLRYPADIQHSGTIVDSISRIGWMSGGHAAWWTDEDMATLLTHRAEAFLAQNTNHPFFLYFALNDIHVPRAPNQRFLGTSGCGIRGDAIEEMDWSVGDIMATLNRLHLAKNTLVIFSSDNGPIVLDGYSDGSLKNLNGHKPSGPFRGGKYQIYEGGTRLPFISSWPGHVVPGVSNALIGQQDLFASLVDIAGIGNGDYPGTDSEDLRNALLNPSASGRDQFVEQCPNALAIRAGEWKYIPSGARPTIKTLEEGDTSAGPVLSANDQLYDLATDPGETHNVVTEQQVTALRLAKLLAHDQAVSSTARP